MQTEKYRKRVEHNVAESTLNARLYGQKSLEEFIGGGEPTVEDVEEWIDHLIDRFNEGDVKASTIKEYFKAVQYYFEIVKGEDGTLDHIKKRIPKNDSDPGDFLTEDEWDLLKSQVRSYRDQAIVELMYHYARRPTEVILLNEEDIQIYETGDKCPECGKGIYQGVDPVCSNCDEEPIHTITFSILKKKDPSLPVYKFGRTQNGWNHEHKVFRATFELEDGPRQALERYLPYRGDIEEEAEVDGEETTVHPLFTTQHGRVSYNTVWRMIKDAADRAGIEKNITPKGMGRHSRATHLDWSGHSPQEVGRHMLLHDPDTNVIGRYVHERSEEQVREVMSTDASDK